MSELFDPAQCVRELHRRFKHYDQVVDIVSCWQAFFTKSEIGKTVSYFDRFPRLREETAQHKEKRYTPDFVVSFGSSYALVGEVKRTFPMGEEEFDRELEQLQNYDKRLLCRVGEKEEVACPTTHDVMLIVALDDSQAILKRIQDRLSDPHHPFKLSQNLIMVEYHYDVLGPEPRYVFRKVAEQPGDFADGTVPKPQRLSTLLTEKRESIKVRPDQFKDIKATWIFCNDDPPPIYTLTFLWTKVFYHLLPDKQRQHWRRADPRKILPLETSIGEIRNFVTSRYVARGSWTDWTRTAIDTLVQAGMARYTSREDCYIAYRNLTVELRVPGLSEEPTEERIADIARILATYICRGRAASNPHQPSAEQQTLGFEQSHEADKVPPKPSYE